MAAQGTRLCLQYILGCMTAKQAPIEHAAFQLNEAGWLNGCITLYTSIDRNVSRLIVTVTLLLNF